MSTDYSSINTTQADSFIPEIWANEAITALKASKISTKKSGSGGKKKKKGVKVSMPKITAGKVTLTKSKAQVPTLNFKKLPKASINLKPRSIKLEKKTYAKSKPIKFRNTLDTSTKLA